MGKADPGLFEDGAIRHDPGTSSATLATVPAVLAEFSLAVLRAYRCADTLLKVHEIGLNGVKIR